MPLPLLIEIAHSAVRDGKDDVIARARTRRTGSTMRRRPRHQTEITESLSGRTGILIWTRPRNVKCARRSETRAAEDRPQSSSSSGRCDVVGLLQTEQLDRLDAHHVFLDLASHRHRKLLNHLNVARDLVMGNPAEAEPPDCVRV